MLHFFVASKDLLGMVVIVSVDKAKSLFTFLDNIFGLKFSKFIKCQVYWWPTYLKKKCLWYFLTNFEKLGTHVTLRKSMILDHYSAFLFISTQTKKSMDFFTFTLQVYRKTCNKSRLLIFSFWNLHSLSLKVNS